MLIRLLLFSTCASQVLGWSCYWNNKCGYSNFGSKTVYDDVRGDIRDTERIEGCKPIGVWALVRHGTRNPRPSSLDAMQDAAKLKDAIVTQNLHEDLGELCAQDITNLQRWSWDSTISTTPGYLTTNGYKEMLELGTRFHQKFLPLLHDLGSYQFRPTLEQRTIKSAEAFIEGLNQGQLNFKKTNATDRDDVLRPYYYCARHKVEVYNGNRSIDEINEYTNTLEFQHMLQRVQNRSGLQEPLTATKVIGFYDLCRYGRAISSTKTSPWCALFADQDLMILEYLNDIRHYFRNGYGSDINRILGGPALKDLFMSFLSIVTSGFKSFTGYFIHDTLIQMVFTALQLNRDYPEISGFERKDERKWRTSFMTPFAGNFAAVLLKCSTKAESDRYQVQFFINEKEFHLCDAKTCSWSQFNEKFAHFLNTSLDVVSYSSSLRKNV
ncbi:unnamed protein product [Chilo suppressalis]|uniref:Multiple inositol polyphosphate phosphatase 1 n=1 Tax=Chilo suppressalis TaxID=168631 RepID=A0ABN8AZR9_CHISP|nr:unnamed protein product [Chilo suppressalis]